MTKSLDIWGISVVIYGASGRWPWEYGRIRLLGQFSRCQLLGQFSRCQLLINFVCYATYLRFCPASNGKM